MSSTGVTLVLGGSGFLGRHVMRCAFEQGDVIGVAGRAESWGLPSWCEQGDLGQRVHAGAGQPMPGELRFLWCDLRRAGAGARLVRETGAGKVILCAALSRVARCLADPEEAELMNQVLPREVAVACADLGVRLVHVSTDQVFDGRIEGRRYLESDEPSPTSVYGLTKARSETAVLRSCPSALVVRLPLLYGRSGGTGEGASDSLIQAVRAGQRPTLFEDEWRTPLEVGEAAAALVTLAGMEVRGLLHLAGPQRMTRHKLGRKVLEQAGYTAAEIENVVRVANRADLGHGDRPRDVSLAGSLALHLLGGQFAAVTAGLRTGLDPLRDPG